MHVLNETFWSLPMKIKTKNEQMINVQKIILVYHKKVPKSEVSVTNFRGSYTEILRIQYD